MNLHRILFVALVQIPFLCLVKTEKQQLHLSDSYLPVVMQVIAHLTDQLNYETTEEPTLSTLSTKPTKPTSTTPKPNRMTTTNPYVISVPYDGSFQPTGHGWWMSYITRRIRFDATTVAHKPGLYAPESPPKPSERAIRKTNDFVLVPVNNETGYMVVKQRTPIGSDPILTFQEIQIDPFSNPMISIGPELPSAQFDVEGPSIRADEFIIDDDYSDENLQYLSPGIRSMLKMANDPNDDRLVDVWGSGRAGHEPVKSKANISASHLRLLLLYDLLTREAKKQKMQEYHGFSDDLLDKLIESANGGARAQLSFALSKMLERKDTNYDYINNRAKELVAELAKDGSAISSELRYLQPLVYSL